MRNGGGSIRNMARIEGDKVRDMRNVMGTRRMEWSGGIRETGREEWKEGRGGGMRKEEWEESMRNGVRLIGFRG